MIQWMHQKSLILLSRQLWNVELPQLFFGLRSNAALDAAVLSKAFSVEG
jgi:hypothetical protein